MGCGASATKEKYAAAHTDVHSNGLPASAVKLVLEGSSQVRSGGVGWWRATAMHQHVEWARRDTHERPRFPTYRKLDRLVIVGPSVSHTLDVE